MTSRVALRSIPVLIILAVAVGCGPSEPRAAKSVSPIAATKPASIAISPAAATSAPTSASSPTSALARARDRKKEPPLIPPTPACMPGRFDTFWSIDVPIPHTAWAKPYSRGPIKVWILSPIAPQGDTVGLLQRFDMDYDIVSCDASWETNTWGMGDVYGKRSMKAQNGRDLELAYAVQDLTSEKHYDLMIVPTVHGWNTYPQEMRKAILRRVEAGAGLVMITPQDSKDRLSDPEAKAPTSMPADAIALPNLSPLLGGSLTAYHWYGDWDRNEGMLNPQPWKVAGGQQKHPIVSGVCWEEMPLATAVSVQDYKQVADGATLIASAGQTPTIAVRQVGKGRVVAINWYCGRQGTGLTPVEDEAKCPTWDYWEQFYNILGRACLYAAQREPQVDLTLGEYRDGKVAIEIDNHLGKIDGSLLLILKDERGQVAWQDTQHLWADKGVSKHSVAIKELSPGTCHLEAILLDGQKKHAAWAAKQVASSRSADIAGVSIGPDAIASGQEVKGEVKLSGSAKAAKVQLELRDPYDRVLARDEQVVEIAGDAAVPYSFTVKNPISLAVFVRARLMLDGKAVKEVDSADAVVTPPEPQFSDYEVIPWGFEARRDLWKVKADQYRAMNATANTNPTAQTLRYGFICKGHAEPAPLTLGIYWYDPGRQRLVDLWKQYKADGDKSKLTRQVCLSDPAVIESVAKTVRDKVAQQKKYNPGTYYIGDESSVTAYTTEIDLDFSPQAIADFQDWCKQRYGGIDKLNDKWQTQYTDFSAIEPFTIIEVEKDPTKACGWAEHRTFMEERYERILEAIRKAGKESDPNAEFELTGTQSATSFNGVDWARHTRHVKRFVPYNINFAYDQLRCFNDGVKMSALTGYGSIGEGVKLSLWNQAVHGLLSANIFWQWSVVNGDMTLSQNAKDIGSVFAELRGGGIGRLLGTTKWVTSPVAIYYSQPSIHAARVQGREGICHGGRNAFCQITRDLGRQFDLVSYLQVEEGQLQKAPPAILILPAVLAVSPKEAQSIIAYVENGGVVLADIAPGVCDERCDFRQNTLLEKLFGDGKTAGTKPVGKGKAILLGDEFGGYKDARTRNRGGEIRKTMLDIFQANDVQPTVPVKAGDQPLTRAETVVVQNGDWKIVAILKEIVEDVRRTTEDGVEYFDKLPEGQKPPVEKISIDLGGEYCVYDIRAGKYLGRISGLQDELASAQTKLYALLPYEVKGMKLSASNCANAGGAKAAPSLLMPGSAVTISAAVDCGQAKPGQHVFNIHVYGPDGKELFYHQKNILAEGGKAEFLLPIELNPPKSLKVTVTDVLSGATATMELME